MGNKNTTEDQWYSMNQTVGFMFLYCSEELQPVVLAILNEITMREFYMHKIWREQSKCFHYSNLQPLWAEDNLKKGSLYEN